MGGEEPATATTATASSALAEKMRTFYLEGVMDSKVKVILIYESLGDINALVTLPSLYILWI